jgi:transcriptional regulator with XRE-family HTH domain
MPAVTFSPEALRRIRVDRNFSVTRLAADIGRTEGSVQGYEAGRFAPSTDVLGRLADVLDCSVSDLFASTPEPAL